MLAGKRLQDLEARVLQLEARVAVGEMLYGMVIGLSLRAAPADVRDEIFRDLRASMGGAASNSDVEAEALRLDESISQIIDAIENVARSKSST